MEKIPFVDLHAQYLSIKSVIDEAIFSTINSSAFIGGPKVTEFEDSFGKLIGAKYVISCANGTDSLEILLKSFGIGQGDEVIVPAISWISTSEAVSNCGAKPIFVDIEEDYYCIDATLIEAAITANTKAIIPVHLYGQVADMKAIMDIAERYQLTVIEDCAQAHLAAFGNKLVGTWGHAASFSFYPGKNLGAYGDAGAMITNDEKVSSIARMIANHGQQGKHNHMMEGRNSRLDGIQAAVLSAKIPFVEAWTKRRQEKARQYTAALSQQYSVITPKVRSESTHVFHLYVIRTERRDEMKQWLESRGIETAIHYPLALPFLPPYNADNDNVKRYPVARMIQKQILSLPLYPELQANQIERITTAIKSFDNSILDRP